MAFTPVSGSSPTNPTPKPYASGFTPVGAAAAQQEDEGGFGLFDFVGNVAEEAGAMVQGITSLVGAGVHDAANLVKEGVTLGAAETDGFKLDDIAMALPSALAQDYDQRYGISKFADGDIWGGLKAILTGLYERPLSAIGDALMVGAGAKVAAKAGLAGETLGSKILGPGSLEAVSLTGGGEAKAVTALGLSQNPVARIAQRKLYDVASFGTGLSDRAAGKLGFGDAGSYIDRISDPGAASRATVNEAFARASELPVLRPSVSRAIEARGISKSLSLLGLNVQDRTAVASNAIRQILRPDGKPTLDEDLFVSGSMGTKAVALPDQVPSNANPTHFAPVNDVDLPQGVGELASPGLDAPNMAAAVSDFRGNMVRLEPGAKVISPHDRGTTEANKVVLLTDDMGAGADMARRYASDVGGTIEWRQNYAQVAGEQPGSSYLGLHYGIRSRDGALHDVSIATPDMLEAQRAWSHMSMQADAKAAELAALEGPFQMGSQADYMDGPIAEALEQEGYVYHATPQENLPGISREGLLPRNDVGQEPGVYVGDTWSDADRLSPHQANKGMIRIPHDRVPDDTEFGDYMGEGIVPTRMGPEGMEVLGERGNWISLEDAAKYVEAQDELAAIQAFNAHTFDFQRRSMNGGDYDPVLQALDKSRYTIYNHATAAEIRHGLTFRKAMDRSFGAIRAERWSEFMRNIESDLAQHFEMRAGTKPEDMLDDVIAIVERNLGVNNPWTERIMRSLRDEVLEFESPDNLPVRLVTGEKTILSDGNVLRGYKTDPAKTAKRLTDKLRAATHEAFVENGEFPGLDWRTLLREQTEAGLPIPQYYPHIRAANATGDVVMGSQKSRILESETNRMKKWGGWLYEHGLYERDPIRAYEALFHQVAKHNEFRDAMLNLVGKYGRVVPDSELAAWTLRNQAEVLVSENGLKGMVNSRTKLMTLTHEGVMAGKTLEDATMDAVRTLTDDALESFAEGMKGDKIYALPRHVASKMNRSAHINQLIPGTFNFWYDTAQGLWKAQVLKLSPRWVINNTLGNLVFMGVRNPGAIRRFISELMPGAESRARALLGNDLIDDIHRDFMHTERLLPQNERMALRAEKAGVDAGVRLSESPLQNRAPVRGLRKVADAITRLNTHIEDAARRGVAINALSKQRIRGVAGRFESTNQRLIRLAEGGIPSKGSYDSVIADVNATLGDYLTMSPVESQIIRRYIMPFYAFYRHTVKYIARMPFEHPLKVKVLEQINEIDRQMNPYMPDYMRGSFEIWDGMFMRFGGANPLQAVTENAYWPSVVNPMLGLAIQRTTGKNPFGQPWYPPAGSVVETAGGDRFAVMRDGDGRVTGVRQFEGEWQPPLYESLIGTAMPLAGLIYDPFDRAVAKRALGPLTGMSYNDTFSPETEAYYQTRAYIDALKRAASMPPPQ